MIEKTIQGIKYRLDEENLTAEVLKKKGYEGDIIIPEIVELENVAYRVTGIGENAFRECSSLTSVTIPNSVTSIGENAFDFCESLTSIVIPNSVTSIDYGTFFYCKSLTSVVLPESLTYIGQMAFSCCSSLTSMAFNGTKAQWKGIELGDRWKTHVPAEVIHCTDGDVEI